MCNAFAHIISLIPPMTYAWLMIIMALCFFLMYFRGEHEAQFFVRAGWFSVAGATLIWILIQLHINWSMSIC